MSPDSPSRDAPDPSTAPTLPQAPQREILARIGGFVLLQRLGEGGMGEVWLAEQQQPVHRKVALKIMKAGLGSGDMLARFEGERQALALMSHPAIARVLEAGVAADGRPWFAMELVDGQPVTRWCDTRGLPIPERLELFVRICAGVEHAHQRGIIHRDIKPANVLVAEIDGRPEPRIIDFGIAKAVGIKLSEETLLTEAGLFMGTPEYMSPEQADPRIRDIDTRTDVYALGVVLYELLTGMLPVNAADLRQCSLAEAQRRICEDEPRRPSTRVRSEGTPEAAAARGLDEKRWHARLRGDLDWIALRALEKDRERRYASVRELADDVDRHLRDEPVRARFPGAAYVARKFVRRHRIAVAAALAVVTALLLGAAGTVAGLVEARHQGARARHEADVATRVSDLLAGIFELSAPERARGNSMTVREALDRGVERVESDLRDQPEVRARLQAVLGRVHEGLGDLEQARAELEAALETRRSLFGPDDAAAIETQVRLAGVLRQLARYDESERLARDAGERSARTLGAEADVSLAALGELATIMGERDRLDDASSLARQVLEARERLHGASDPATLTSRLQVARLAGARGGYEETSLLAGDVLERREALLGSDHPATLEARNVLADALSHLGRHDEALRLHQANLAELERVLGPESPGTLETLVDLAETQDRAGALDDAEAYYRRALGILVASRGPGHVETARAQADLAALLYRRGRLTEAEHLIRTAQASYDAAHGGEHVLTVVNLGLLAVVVREQGRTREALDLYQRLYEARRVQRGEVDWETLGTLRRIAALQGTLGLEAERRRTLDGWIELQARRLGEGHRDLEYMRAEWHALLGRDSEALAALGRAVDLGWADPETLQRADAFTGLRARPELAGIARRVGAAPR